MGGGEVNLEEVFTVVLRERNKVKIIKGIRIGIL